MDVEKSKCIEISRLDKKIKEEKELLSQIEQVLEDVSKRKTKIAETRQQVEERIETLVSQRTVFQENYTVIKYLRKTFPNLKCGFDAVVTAAIEKYLLSTKKKTGKLALKNDAAEVSNIPLAKKNAEVVNKNLSPKENSAAKTTTENSEDSGSNKGSQTLRRELKISTPKKTNKAIENETCKAPTEEEVGNRRDNKRRRGSDLESLSPKKMKTPSASETTVNAKPGSKPPKEKRDLHGKISSYFTKPVVKTALVDDAAVVELSDEECELVATNEDIVDHFRETNDGDNNKKESQDPETFSNSDANTDSN